MLICMKIMHKVIRPTEKKQDKYYDIGLNIHWKTSAKKRFGKEKIRKGLQHK